MASYDQDTESPVVYVAIDVSKARHDCSSQRDSSPSGEQIHHLSDCSVRRVQLSYQFFC